MKKRFFSTICLLSMVALTCIYGGVFGCVIMLSALSLLAQYELYSLLKKISYRPHVGLGISGGFLLLIGYYLLEPNIIMGLLGVMISIGAITLILSSQRRRFLNEQFIPTLFGLIYIPFMMQFYIRTALLYPENSGQGILVVVWAILTAKFTDIGGLLIGTRFGKHKLAPRISPNKSWEGLAGGMIFSLIFSVSFVILLKEYLPENLSVYWAAVIAIPIAYVSLMSDLIESAIKRLAGAKDSGNSIPGIGGAFDLIDSLILVAPLIYVVLLLLNKYV